MILIFIDDKGDSYLIDESYITHSAIRKDAGLEALKVNLTFFLTEDNKRDIGTIIMKSMQLARGHR